MKSEMETGMIYRFKGLKATRAQKSYQVLNLASTHHGSWDDTGIVGFGAMYAYYDTPVLPTIVITVMVRDSNISPGLNLA